MGLTVLGAFFVTVQEGRVDVGVCMIQELVWGFDGSCKSGGCTVFLKDGHLCCSIDACMSERVLDLSRLICSTCLGSMIMGQTPGYVCFAHIERPSA